MSDESQDPEPLTYGSVPQQFLRASLLARASTFRRRVPTWGAASEWGSVAETSDYLIEVEDVGGIQMTLIASREQLRDFVDQAVEILNQDNPAVLTRHPKSPS